MFAFSSLDLRLHHKIAIFLLGVFVVAGLLGITIYALGAGLGSTNVQPAFLTTGVSGTVTVSFTTITSVPANGKIKVTFPVGFTVSGATSGTCSTMDGTFVTSVDGQVVTITRQGDGTEQIGAEEICTIGGIVNPTVAGQGGTYALETTDNSDVQLDSDAAVTSDGFSAASLTFTNVEPATLTAGSTNVVTMTFVTQNLLASDGKVKVTFPAGFTVSGATGGTCSTMDGTFVTSVDGQVVTLTRQGDGSSEPAGAQTCTVGGIVNPASTGSTGTYTLQTANSSDQIHDAANSVTADVITAGIGALSNTNVTPDSLVAGASGAVTVVFTTATNLPANGKMKVTFPAGFTVSGVSSGSCSSMDGSVEVSIAGQIVTLTRQNDGTLQAAGEQETCSFTSVQNPPVAGATGTYTLQTTNALNTVLDADSAVTEDTLFAAALTSTNVQPASLIAGASGLVTISFSTVNALGSDGKVKVTFPAGFTVSGATSGTCSTMDGTFATSVDGQVVTLTRQGDGSSEPAGAQTCTVGGIVNPSVAGGSGVYALSTITANNRTHDTDASVSSDTIFGGTLLSPNVEPATSLVAARTHVAVSFTSVNLLENNGKVKITFPAAFTVSGATSGTCSTMDGAFATSVDGQTVVLTRSGGTTAFPGIHRCTVAGIINPFFVGLAGAYTIVTTNADDVIHDEHASIESDFFSRGAASSLLESSEDAVYVLELLSPTGGSYTSGDITLLSWSTEGSSVDPGFITLSYSPNGGTFWKVITTNTINDGIHPWIVPHLDAEVILKIEATDLVTVLATDFSEPLTLGLGNTSSQKEEGGEVAVEEEVIAEEEILEEAPVEAILEDVLPEVLPAEEATNESVSFVPGTFMRSFSQSVTYYIDTQGVKHPFLDEQTFFTYADSFDEVMVVDEDQLEVYPEGSPMLPQAGTVLVKTPTEDKVYALEYQAGGLVLRWITSETLASTLYGSAWRQYVLDILSTVWEFAVFGEDVSTPADLEVHTDHMYLREELHVR